MHVIVCAPVSQWSSLAPHITVSLKQTQNEGTSLLLWKTKIIKQKPSSCHFELHTLLKTEIYDIGNYFIYNEKLEKF